MDKEALDRLLKELKQLQREYRFDIVLEKIEKLIKNREFEKFREYKNYILQLQAQCYYQDSTLPAKSRFKKALDILDTLPKDNETLRLIGAVYKRKYQHSKDIRDLYKAISYYELASKDINEDMGYGAGNAIYLYFLLIKEIEKSNKDSNIEIINFYLSKVETLATKAIDILEKQDNLEAYHYASLSDLYISLGNFEKAKEAFFKYKSKSSSQFDRDQYITIKQKIELFNILPKSITHSLEDLKEILSPYEKRDIFIESTNIGKIGLALSGGGFRASLFHIGVLLKLAELDILRHVQVVSTVSGGSIIGVYYYLYLKKMLETKENSSITKQDYIDLVLTIKEEFSKAIRENNIRMEAFSRFDDLTNNLANLYQKILYEPIYDKEPLEYMSQLKIDPKVDGKLKDEFIPEFNNFELKNKIPKIIINATILNNGHNWQFSADGMGENRYMVDESIEKSRVYEFKYYPIGAKDIKQWRKDIKISQAVASSSAVPILFDPMELRDYDESGDIIRLSDGGLYDNLGLSSLIADECNHIIVSDGSKQLDNIDNPSIFRLDVSSRTTDILMHRTRDGEYKRAKSLYDRGIIEKLDIMHLKSSVDNLDKELQQKLASIRTDLDSFHQLEAEALIYAGYKIASSILKNKDSSRYFDKFEKSFISKKQEILKILDISSNIVLKSPRLMLLKRSYLISIILIISLLLLLGGSSWYILFGLFAILLIAIRYSRFLKLFIKRVVAFILHKLLYPISKIDKIFNKIYLKIGSLD